jgi:hypothetical protein
MSADRATILAATPARLIQCADAMENNESDPVVGGNQNEENAEDDPTPPPIPRTDQEKPCARRCTELSDRSSRPERFWDFKASHWVTAGLTGALVWVGCLQVGIYRKQADIMNNQIIEMQSEQRAWVSLTKDSGMERLSINTANDLRSTIKTTLQNTGKNPAVSVFVNAEMSIGTTIPYGSMAAWQTAICGRSAGSLGTTMFPGSPEPVFEIETGLTAREATERRNANPVLAFAPVIAGCIVYADAVTNRMHHRPIAFEIRVRVPGLNRGCCGIIAADLPLKEEDLVLRPWVKGDLRPD